MSKPTRLNNRIAVAKRPMGRILIYSYYEDDGEIKQNAHASVVVLDEEAIGNLVNFICEENAPYKDIEE